MEEEKKSLDIIADAQKTVKQNILLTMNSYQRTIAESDLLRKEIAILEQRQNRPYSGMPFKTYGGKGNQEHWDGETEEWSAEEVSFLTRKERASKPEDDNEIIEILQSKCRLITYSFFP